MSKIKSSTLDELKKMREDANTVEYKSLEEMEPIVMEYVNAQPVWQNFMDIATAHSFEEIFQDMIYILHFIHDVKTFKAHNPGKLFQFSVYSMSGILPILNPRLDLPRRVYQTHVV